VEFAFASNAVQLVRAHTLPASSASTSVLTRCRFERVAEVVGPEDGLVWRWEIRRGGDGPPIDR
jgi:[ribosomal protein S5]-alanine N-acetyltransferase